MGKFKADYKLDIASLTEEFSSFWRNENPTTSIVNGGDFNHFSLEDLTQNSFNKQIKFLSELKTKVNSISCNDNIEHLLKKELLRSIRLKLFVLESDNPYYKNISAYLKLISLTLYIHQDKIQKYDKESHVIIKKILNWLNIAKELQLNITKKDMQLMSDLGNYLIEIHLTSRKSIALLIYKIIDRLDELSSKEIQYSNGGLSINKLNYLVKYCYGTEKDINYWREYIITELDNEIKEYKTNLYEMNNLKTKIDSTISQKLIYNLLNDLSNLGEESNIRKPLDSSWNIEKLPSLFSNFLNEGIYIHNNKFNNLLISSKIMDYKQKLNIYQIAHLYTFLSHEIYPGHHNHISSINNEIIKNNLDSLYNPIGLEGWAVYSEQILKLTSFRGYSNLFNIKRLLPAAIYLETLINGEEKGDILINKIFNSCSELYDEYKKNGGFGTPNLSYVLGYLEYKEILSCNENININELISYGPLTPRFIIDNVYK
ncbi:hypothetical protein CAI16_19325 [Virgibacillus dokdonensis]|uniref:DUF885 domain-containing protein n=1 Tax=Virgibacillus dokdonensis TaxID=302167 RepID=A0A3E0WGB5_9BACI|nr:DUF885 family protein [Virgibacillus dokdonensis]RFA31982.1 hypothetical protein CAI16_19325 [Virgibacillus dokdonensis]